MSRMDFDQIPRRGIPLSAVDLTSIDPGVSPPRTILIAFFQKNSFFQFESLIDVVISNEVRDLRFMRFLAPLEMTGNFIIYHEMGDENHDL